MGNVELFEPALAGTTIADDVRRGLTAQPKTLPPHLLYDERGSRLYEAITRLPEYYLTRAERAIFAVHGADVVARALDGGGPLDVVELGAGTATKTEILLREVLVRQSRCVFVPIDVAREPLREAADRLRADLPRVDVRPLVATHERAFDRSWPAGSRHLVLFIGSSVGNFEDAWVARLLRSVRCALGPQTFLVLGTDLRKDPAVLLPAYDDAQGVTAAFNRNVLARINRELSGHFALETFRHVARWNEVESRIEMHLQSTVAQTVPIDALRLRVRFDAGETIHTESSIKYDLPRVVALLRAGGFTHDVTYTDEPGRFAVHVARAA